MINTLKIKAKMVEFDITQKKLAEELRLSQSTINLKLNNSRAMYLEEAEKISVLLKIPSNEFSDYFFKQ